MNKQNYLLKCLIIILLVFCLGSPTFHFDARWIWLFKGKQIFINNNLEFLREEYFQGLVWQSYPLLGPSLASGIANILDNGMDTKSLWSNLIIASTYIFKFFCKKKLLNYFYFNYLFVLEKSLIIGEMDG